jgi:hypothetical protein
MLVYIRDVKPYNPPQRNSWHAITHYIHSLPTTLKNIGPNLDAALKQLTHDLLQIHTAQGREMKHIVTTYTLSIIAIIFDALGSEKSIDALLIRLRFDGNTVQGYPQDNKGAIEAANAQLQRVRDLHPDMPFPFRCFQGWRGHGSKDMPLYERMVEASKSPKTWQQFRDLMRHPASPQQSQGGEEPEAETAKGEVMGA